jgi:hypothetical protein
MSIFSNIIFKYFPCHTLCFTSELNEKITCMFCSCNEKLKLDLSFIKLELQETSMANVYYNKECGNNKSLILMYWQEGWIFLKHVDFLYPMWLWKYIMVVLTYLMWILTHFKKGNISMISSNMDYHRSTSWNHWK